MPNHIQNAIIDRIHQLSGHARERSEWAEECAQFRLGEVIEARAHDRPLAGANLWVMQEAARRRGENYDPRRLIVPTEVLARANTVVSYGPSLVGTDVPPLAQLLRPLSVVARAGVQFLTGLRSNIRATTETAGAPWAWLSTESTGIVDTPNQTLAEQPCSPHTGGATVRWSRQAYLQSPQFEQMATRDLLSCAAAGADSGAIAGTGTAGAPTGLLSVSGTGAESGTAFNTLAAATMKAGVLNSNAADDGTLAFVMPPTLQGVLESRDRATGTGRYVVEDGHMVNVPVLGSNTVPANTVVCGRWSDLLVAVWGDGVELEITPFASSGDFVTGTVAGRVLLSMDVAVRRPGSFVIAGSVT